MLSSFVRALEFPSTALLEVAASENQDFLDIPSFVVKWPMDRTSDGQSYESMSLDRRSDG